MQYDGEMLLASVLLLLPILLIATVVSAVLQKLGFIPSGVASLPAYALVVVGGYVLLFIGAAAHVLIQVPAQFQKEHLGRVYGTPLTLRRYQHTGFQDPEDDWVYALDAVTLAELKRRCTHAPALSPDPPRCVLSSGEDARRDFEIWIETDELHLLKGLH